jgi:hypothetical protein
MEHTVRGHRQTLFRPMDVHDMGIEVGNFGEGTLAEEAAMNGDE